MQITSPAFQNQQSIPSKYTCDGAGVNPELIFSNVPENAQSLVLIYHDPDAPKPGGWTHWLMIDMEPSTPGIAENTAPNSGTELTTDYGKPGYKGPCPPSGSHRYIFYLYALDAMLNLNSSSTKKDVEAAMEGHVIEVVQLVGVYERI
jgi:Raf kinase inhibitor-like YbhB/YbcL family protein